MGARLPAPVGPANVARAASGCPHRILLAYPVPPERAVHATAVAPRDPGRTTRRRSLGLPITFVGLELFSPGSSIDVGDRHRLGTGLRGSGYSRRFLPDLGRLRSDRGAGSRPERPRSSP